MWRRAGTVVRRAGASTIIPVRPLYRRADVQGSSLHDRPESPRRGGFRLGSLDVSDLVARPRSEERRVGKACVSTCSSRCSPFHYKTFTSILFSFFFFFFFFSF